MYLLTLVFLLSVCLVAASLPHDDQRTVEAVNNLQNLYAKMDKMPSKDITPEFMKQVAHAIHELPRADFADVIDNFDNEMRTAYSGDTEVLLYMGISAKGESDQDPKPKSVSHDKSPPPQEPAKPEATLPAPIKNTEGPTPPPKMVLDFSAMRKVREQREQQKKELNKFRWTYFLNSPKSDGEIKS